MDGLIAPLLAALGVATTGGAGGVLSAIGALLGVLARWGQQAQIDRHELRKADQEHRHEMERMDKETALAKIRGEIAITQDQLKYEAEALMARATAAAADASTEWSAMRESVAQAMTTTGNKIVDILNGLQRPMVVYGLFIPYLTSLFVSWAIQVYRGTDALLAFSKTYVGFPEMLLASIAGWLFADRTLRHYKRGA